ncbi:MAG: Stf0 family sulfotransferase, partial [Alphaproteobacteria bacterium]
VPTIRGRPAAQPRPAPPAARYRHGPGAGIMKPWTLTITEGPTGSRSKDLSAFGRELRRYRTLSNGCLGASIHSSHLPYFLSAIEAFSDLDVIYVHLTRRDVIAQAVSHHIASQTRQWSSRDNARSETHYDYKRIQYHLNSTAIWNAEIKAFLTTRKADYIEITYEDLVSDPAAELGKLPFQFPDTSLTSKRMKRQSNSVNKEYVNRFRLEFAAEMEARRYTSQSNLGTIYGKANAWLGRNVPGYWRLTR